MNLEDKINGVIDDLKDLLNDIKKPKGNYPYTVLVDAGHGGIDKKGNYTTSPLKQFSHPQGVFYEGVYNRIIADMLCEELKKHSIDYLKIYHKYIDTPLHLRSERVNEICKHKKCFVISIHSNASVNHLAHGWEVFTSKGQTLSDKIATLFYNEIKELSARFHFRMRADKWSDGDNDKEANFWMLRKTKCPSILVENLFFDNKKDYQLLINNEFNKSLVQSFVQAIILTQKNL